MTRGLVDDPDPKAEPELRRNLSWLPWSRE